MTSSLRRRILALTAGEHQRLTHGRDGARVLNDPFTTVVTVPLDEEQRLHPQLRQLEDSGVLVPGAVLVQNVFSRDRYVPINNIWLQFGRAKYNAVQRVCQLLGAHYVDILDAKRGLTGRFASAVARVSSLRADATVDFREDMMDRLQLEVDFEGGAAHPDAAWDYMTEHGLHHDMDLLALLELRRDERNRPRTHVMRMELLSEAQTQFTFGLSLAEMIKAVSPMSLNIIGGQTKLHHAQVKICVGFVPRTQT